MDKTEEYIAAIKPEDIWIFPKVSPTIQRKYYDKESLVHPAKMPTYFVQKIISEYSNPGDLILDPMAGIGTTLIEAILLGRNAIGVEYEQKFVSIIERNIKSVEAFRSRVPNMGHAIILKGDSRYLSKVLGENAGLIDTVAFSPPYADSVSAGKSKEREKRLLEAGKNPKEFIGGTARVADMEFNYSKDKNNIGCLPHGSIDTVITSPPFANEGINKKGEGTPAYRQTGFAKCASYSTDNVAFGEYGKVDAVISSPPFENNEPFQDKNFSLHGKQLDENYTYTQDKNDLTNLPNLSGETYLEAMLKVYKECFSVLKQGGIMALVLKNFVRNGEMVRLDLDTIKLCEAAGFEFKERKYRKLETVSFWIRNQRKKFYIKNPHLTSGDPSSQYEDILIFKKGNK